MNSKREWYVEAIIKMLRKIDDERFLNQIRTIMRIHLTKQEIRRNGLQTEHN